MVRELLSAGLLHDDVQTIAGPGLSRFATTPVLTGDSLSWAPASTTRETTPYFGKPPIRSRPKAGLPS